MSNLARRETTDHLVTLIDDLSEQARRSSDGEVRRRALLEDERDRIVRRLVVFGRLLDSLERLTYWSKQATTRFGTYATLDSAVDDAEATIAFAKEAM